MTSFLDKTSLGAIFAMLVLLPLVSHAGGLGIAPLIFILGVFGFILTLKTKRFIITKVQFALIGFLTWLCVTALWSPYRPDDLLTNYLKLFLMVIVYYWSTPLFEYAGGKHSKRLRHMLMAMATFAVGLLVIDLLSHFGLTLLFNPASDSNDKIFKVIDAEMNLGHSITILVLLAGPVTMLMLSEFPKHIAGLAIILFVAFLAWAARLNGLTVGLLGLLTVIIAVTLGYAYPRRVPALLLSLVIIMIMTSPLLSFIALNYVGENGTELAQSWDHRLRMWAYSWQVIAENPIKGAGFDASRTFEDTFITKDGHEMTIVSLHPHNAGIQIWLESGFIGALLASTVIAALFRPVKNYVQSQVHGGAVSGVIIAALVISSITYGAWQFWWWGSIFLAIGALYLLPRSEDLILLEDEQWVS